MALLLNRNEVDNLTSEKMEKILELKFVENNQLDYKETLDFERRRETYKELLKDITSFANSRGGMIIIGSKEPSEDVDLKDQIVGIENSKTLSEDMERVCANSIEPRIPGLVITYIKVLNEKELILIYIPPSIIKPHMVDYNKHRSFYIRHSESSVPMSVQEIRDSVLFSSNIEKYALTKAQEEEYDIFEYYIKDEPSFVFQAVPFQPLEKIIDIESQIVQNIIAGSTRSSGGNFPINSMIAPTPTIKGIMGSYSRTEKKWYTEIHRNGIIQLIYFIRPEHSQDQITYNLYDQYLNLINTFFDFCEEIWDKLQIDVQYLLRCKIINTRDVIYYPNNNFRSEYEKFNITHIEFENLIRNIGENLSEKYKVWESQYYNVQGRWK